MKRLRMIAMALVAMVLAFGMNSCEKDGDITKELSEYVSNQELESLDCYTDIHLHLDGSMSVEMIRELARIQNMPLSYTDEELCSDYKSVEEFPYRAFIDKGVKFTINSDNMSVSNTTVKEEFIALNDTFGIKRSELLQLLSNSIDAAFITDAEKAQLKKKSKPVLWVICEI